MRIKLIILTLFSLLFGVNSAFASHIVINEVYYDVDSTHGQETNNEWVELFNTSTSDVDLTGWTITDNSSSRTLASVIVKANSTLVIAAQSSTWNFWNITGDKIALNANLGNGLSNDGDKLLLKDNSGVEHDKLSYGSNSDYPPSLPDINEGHSLERIPAGSDFADQLSPTPGVTSTSIFSLTPSPSPSPSPSSNSSSSPSTSSTSSSSSFTISSVPSTIDSTETFNISVSLSLSNSPNSNFYLKGAFKKSDGSNYFGLTKVSSNWVKNSASASDQYEITTDSSGNWSGNLEVKIDAFDSGYTGSGDYIFKVGRYSDSGTNLTWSNEQTVKINAKEIGETDSADEEIGVINLSGQSHSPKTEVLAKSTQSPNISEEPYSLEKYVKKSSESATVSGAEISKIKSKGQLNPFVIAGSIIILVGLGSLVYFYYKFRLKS